MTNKQLTQAISLQKAKAEQLTAARKEIETLQKKRIDISLIGLFVSVASIIFIITNI